MYLDTEWAHDPVDRSDSRAARPSASLSAHKSICPASIPRDFSLAYPPAVCNNILYKYHAFKHLQVTANPSHWASMSHNVFSWAIKTALLLTLYSSARLPAGVSVCGFKGSSFAFGVKNIGFT